MRKEMRDAWDDAIKTNREQGGDFVRKQDSTKLKVDRWPAGEQAKIKPPPAPPSPTYGSFHTHQNQGIDPKTGWPWNPAPSVGKGADTGTVTDDPGRFAPHYVISHPGVYMIDASGGVTFLGTRASVLGPP
jgi:hypothetical protein